MTEFAAILLAALIGAGSGILSASWKSRKDLEAEYDIDLRKRRIDAYRALWKELQVLAEYSPPGEITHAGMRRLSVALRRWYFERGGLFLSVGTRDRYFDLQNALTAVSGAHDGVPDDALDPGTARVVKTLASRLRTRTTEDVATRVRPRLAPSLLARLRRRWRRTHRPLSATVDRRWAWEQGRAQSSYFVLLENRSDREVKVTGLELDRVVVAHTEPKLGSDRPFLVQPGEPREIAVVFGEQRFK